MHTSNFMIVSAVMETEMRTASLASLTPEVSVVGSRGPSWPRDPRKHCEKVDGECMGKILQELEEMDYEGGR